MSKISGVGFNDVNLFQALDIPVGGVLIFWGIYLAGAALVFVAPGLLFCCRALREEKRAGTVAAWSFLISLLLMICSISLYKLLTFNALNRTALLIIAAAVIVAGAVYSRIQSGNGLYVHIFDRSRFSLRTLVPYLSLAIVILYFSSLHDGLFARDTAAYSYQESVVLAIPLGWQGDDLEAFGLADSLKRHIWPYWDLEYADKFGYVLTDPPLNAFMNLFCILLFGESKASLAAGNVAWTLILFCMILGAGTKGKGLRVFLCAGLMFGALQFYLKDPWGFLLPQHFQVFLLVVMYAGLIDGRHCLSFCYAVAATLVKFYSAFFVGLACVSYGLFFGKEKRKAAWSFLGKYGSFLAGLGVFGILLGYFTGNLDVYFRTFLVEHFNRVDYFDQLARFFPQDVVYPPRFAMENSMRFLGWCLEGTMYLFPVIFLFGKNRTENFYAFIAVTYFILVFLSRYNLPRYIIPLVPLVAIIACSKIEGVIQAGRNKWSRGA